MNGEECGTGSGAKEFFDFMRSKQAPGIYAGYGSFVVLRAVLGSVAGGLLADRIGRRPVLIGSSLLAALFLEKRRQ